MTIRFGILAGVSSDVQVIDKDSIPDQIETCRRAIQQFNGIETDCYIMDGYSRSGYDSLADAMEDIPPLKQAITDAEQNQYDVLIVDNWDRLGDLGQLVHTRYKKYRKQLYSARQSGRLQDPQNYDPYADESASIDIHIQGILQTYRINKLRRGWSLGMPKRIKDGLTPSRMAYGYKYTTNREPPALDPSRAAKLIQARDMLMNGESYRVIGVLLGVHHTRVPTVLANPYYAGIVAYNKTLIQYVGKVRRQVKQPKSKWRVGEGKHQPIFTQAEHEEIVAEIERRNEIKRRSAVDFAFAGLLRCAVCGDRVRRHKFGSRRKFKDVIICRSAGAKHVRYDYEEFFDLTVRAIQREIEHVQLDGEEEAEIDSSAVILRAIEANAKQRGKIQEGFERDVYSAEEAAAKLRELEREAERLQDKLEQIAVKRASQKEATAFMQTVDFTHFGEYLRHGDAKQINRLLAAWLLEIQVGDEIKLIKR